MVATDNSIYISDKAKEKANVTAIYGDGISRVELHITDWDEAAAIPQQIGVGLGSRALDRPNLLRLVLARPVEGADPLAADGDPAGPGERPEPLL